MRFIKGSDPLLLVYLFVAVVTDDGGNVVANAGVDFVETGLFREL
ncbi:MAG: hypothetical protein Q9N62_12610 [Ghiorsea sp.]|nr:hypothetical protein [Ghiorsea sp.]